MHGGGLIRIPVAALAYTALATYPAVSVAPPIAAQEHILAGSEGAAYRQGGDLRSQRRHAWNIVSRLTQASADGTAPIFESWHRAEDVFATAGDAEVAIADKAFSLSTAHGQASVAQVSIATGSATTQTGEAPVITDTLYNKAAYDHIRGNNLHQGAELERLRRLGTSDAAAANGLTVPPFPADAIVALTAWWPVARDRITPLPVWDPEDNQPRQGGNNYTTWQRAVAIDRSPDTRTAPTASIDFVGRAFPHARRISLDSFHYIVVDRGMAEKAMRDSRMHKAAVIALGRSLEVGDYLVLVAVHVATKEIRNWVWVTLWWHDRPDQGPFAEDRPAALKGAWRNYLLDVAFDAEIPAAADGGPRVCFNPWLEARFPDGGMGGGTVSNCVACHSRASYPPVSFLPVTRGGPEAAAGDPAYAPGRLSTNFIWSLARQTTSTTR